MTARTKKGSKEETGKSTSGGVDSKDQLASLLNKYKDDHFNYQKRVDWKISTGSLLIDSEIGGISPSLIRMCGVNNSGKTPQTLELTRNFLKDVPNSKCLWFLAEGRGLSEENKTRCGLKFVYTPEEWEVGTVFVLESNIFEVFINAVKTLVKENPHNIKYAFVVDSVDGLQLRDDSKKEIGESSRVAGVPSLSKRMMQSLSLGMFKFGHLMILISQVTAEISLEMYAKKTDRGGSFSGGNTLLHAADYIFEFDSIHNGDIILDSPTGKFNDGKSNAIGRYARLFINKSIKETAKKKKIVYPIKYGRKPSGIWVEREIVDCLELWKLIPDTTWKSFSPSLLEELEGAGITDLPEKVQGINKMYSLVEERPDLRDFLYKKCLRMINGE